MRGLCGLAGSPCLLAPAQACPSNPPPEWVRKRVKPSGAASVWMEHMPWYALQRALQLTVCTSRCSLCIICRAPRHLLDRKQSAMGCAPLRSWLGALPHTLRCPVHSLADSRHCHCLLCQQMAPASAYPVNSPVACFGRCNGGAPQAMSDRSAVSGRQPWRKKRSVQLHISIFCYVLRMQWAAPVHPCLRGVPLPPEGWLMNSVRKRDLSRTSWMMHICWIFAQHDMQVMPHCPAQGTLCFMNAVIMLAAIRDDTRRHLAPRQQCAYIATS